MPGNIWEDILGSPKYIVAPMVEASELAWRLLSRRYGAQLCYTPMLHSANFVKDPKYRQESLQSCADDEPLIVQFCGNDPNILLKAGLLAQDHCCAIDINLGCPQAIAKRGHYGAFLQDEWPLLEEIVSTLSRNLKVPVTCKIRVFEDVQKTLDYALMLEKAGCSMLTVHGRTREQKGPLTGLADWSYVRKIRDLLKIPIISNGNIQCLPDIDRCLAATGAQGVMTAEGNLYNPCLFTTSTPPSWAVAIEYLDLVAQYPCPNSYVRGHLFKLFHHVLALTENTELRIELGAASSMAQFRAICESLRDRYEAYHEGRRLWEGQTGLTAGSSNMELPPWLCQPYVRIAPEDHLRLVERSQNNTENGQNKRIYEDADGNPISRKFMKKMKRISRRPEKVVTESKKSLEKCKKCVNPMGNKCEFKLCKKCCRDKCYIDCLDCPGHRILTKTRRERAIFHKNTEAGS